MSGSGGKSIEFFDAQFQRQVRDGEYALNPFEVLAQPYISGSVLDIGSGLGNLSLEAGRRGCRVLAVDASAMAVNRINEESHRAGLLVHAIRADLNEWKIDRQFDTIIAIGLLMFFGMDRARHLLNEIKAHVAPGGHAIVNVLIEGTSYMKMFDPGNYYLFGRSELDDQFADWTIELSRIDSYPAPDQTVKEFSTVIAKRPTP
jgi:tellurite methyltransferase